MARPDPPEDDDAALFRDAIGEVRRMEDALARTFVTPLDREDLHRLTSELDDIIDLCNLAARAFNLYHLEKPTPAMIEQVRAIDGLGQA